MPRIPVPMGPSSDTARSRQGGTAELVNCHVEKTEGGRAPFSINTDPGFVLFSNISTAPLRGMHALGNSLYAVSGEYLYSVDSSGTATLLGTVLGQKPVVWSRNRKAPNPQISITTESVNYIIENNVLTTVTDPDLPAGVHSSCFLNGRTLYGLNDGRVFASGNNDSSAVSALAFSEAERDPDNGIRVFANGEEFWYFGEKSLEIFRFDATDLDFPFAPLQGAGQGRGAGCAAKHSVAIMDSAVFWISDAKLVVRASGYQPIRVSNHAVERDIERAVFAGIADEIVAFAWDQQGHQFYHIRCSLWCWVYDAATQEWHRKESYLSPTWLGAFYVEAFNKHLVGDATTGKIYEYTYEARDEAGAALITGIVSRPVHNYPGGLICNALHVDIQAGTGRAAEAARIADPQILLRVSRDGGMTYGREYRQSMGTQGAWHKQARFNRLGRAPGAGLVFETRFPEPVERAVFGAYADVTPLVA